MDYPVYTVPCCLADVVPCGLTWDPAATKLVQEHTFEAGQGIPLSAVISSYVETENGKLAAVTLSSEVWTICSLYPHISAVYLPFAPCTLTLVLCTYHLLPVPSH